MSPKPFLLLTIAYLVLSGSLVAQPAPGLLKLYISPPPETVFVNDSLLSKGNKIVLPVGQHRVRFWAPGYELTDTVLEIKPGETVNFFYYQPRSKAYYDYEKEYSSYRNKRRLNFDLPLLTTVLIAGTSTAAYILAHKAYNEADKALEEYTFENLDPEIAYENYQNKSNDYREKRLIFYGGAGLTLVSGYFLYRGYRWLKKNPGPVFTPGKNPLVLRSLYISPSMGSNQSIQLGMSFNLN